MNSFLTIVMILLIFENFKDIYCMTAKEYDCRQKNTKKLLNIREEFRDIEYILSILFDNTILHFNLNNYL